jgi:hypothetical protein
MLRLSFNLDDADLEHFATVAQQTQAAARSRPADAIVAAAREVLEKAERAQLAGFVKERYAGLATMLAMLSDEQWRLGEEDRQRVVNALACFAPAAEGSGTELLDHAIMIELVSRDLHHDLEAYRDFCRSRESLDQKRRAAPETEREQWLQQRRETLQARMHQRRKRDLDAAGSSVRKLFSLFGL